MSTERERQAVGELAVVILGLAILVIGLLATWAVNL